MYVRRTTVWRAVLRVIWFAHGVSLTLPDPYPAAAHCVVGPLRIAKCVKLAANKVRRGIFGYGQAMRGYRGNWSEGLSLSVKERPHR